MLNWNLKSVEINSYFSENDPVDKKQHTVKKHLFY